MTNILGRLLRMIENAIVEERQISVCTQQGNNRTMSSFVPTECECENSIYVTGEDYSINIDKAGCIIAYDPTDEEFILKCDNVNYYLAMI